MHSSLLHNDNDIQAMRELRGRLASRWTIVDFDEQILLSSIRETTRIWKQDNKIVGFAFVDEYKNLWFETETEFALLDELETEIVEWGVICVKRGNAETGADHTLDGTCNAKDSHRIHVLKNMDLHLNEFALYSIHAVSMNQLPNILCHPVFQFAAFKARMK